MGVLKKYGHQDLNKEKKMKKIFVLGITVLILSFGFISCSSDDSDDGDEPIPVQLRGTYTSSPGNHTVVVGINSIVVTIGSVISPTPSGTQLTPGTTISFSGWKTLVDGPGGPPIGITSTHSIYTINIQGDPNTFVVESILLIANQNQHYFNSAWTWTKS